MNPGTSLIDLQNPETLRLMNQTGLQQCIIPSPATHTACWDTILAPDGHTVWGVAGDEEDMCVVFSYSDDRGLRWLGNAYANSISRGVHSSPQLTAIAVSPDGTMLAIGAGGRMGHVYLYRLEKQ